MRWQQRDLFDRNFRRIFVVVIIIIIVVVDTVILWSSNFLSIVSHMFFDHLLLCHNNASLSTESLTWAETTALAKHQSGVDHDMRWDIAHLFLGKHLEGMGVGLWGDESRGGWLGVGRGDTRERGKEGSHFFIGGFLLAVLAKSWEHWVVKVKI